MSAERKIIKGGISAYVIMDLVILVLMCRKFYSVINKN